MVPAPAINRYHPFTDSNLDAIVCASPEFSHPEFGTGFKYAKPKSGKHIRSPFVTDNRNQIQGHTRKLEAKRYNPFASSAEPDLADCFSVPIMAVISKKHYHGMLLILVVSDNSRGIAQVLLPQGRCEEKPINRLKEQWSLILELLLAGPYCSLATVRTAFLTFLYFCPNRVCERV